MKTNKLHTIKNTGFKAPDNYFEKFEDAILTEIKLKGMVPKSGYTLPENYFNALEEKILNAVKPQKETKVIKLLTWRKAVYTSAVAASLVVMTHIFFSKPETITIDTIETATIENYILNEDLGPTEFASLFTKEDLLDVQLINDGFSSENLEKYVFDNLEIEDIITNKAK